MTTNEKLLSLLLNSKDGDELPLSESSKNTDFIYFFNNETGRTERILKSKFIENFGITSLSDKPILTAITNGQTVFNISDKPENIDIWYNDGYQTEGATYTYNKTTGDVTLINGFSLNTSEYLDVRTYKLGNEGNDGDSAYQVAVNNGFVGTEQEWLESLEGADGLNGSDGANGIDGQDGAQGIQGIQGEKGADAVGAPSGAIEDGNVDAVSGGKVFESQQSLRNDENQFKNIFSDNDFSTGLFEKVSGAGSFEYINFNGVPTLHVTDCIISVNIDFESNVNLSKNWSFTTFINSLSLSSSNIRVIAQALKSNGGLVGDRFDINLTTDLNNKTLLSSNYIFDPLAVQFQIYIDCTGDELYCSNFFIGNAPYAKFVPLNYAINTDNVIYLDGINGDDNNNGKELAPVKTYLKAANLASVQEFPKIIIKEGDYRETLSFNDATRASSCKKLQIIAPTGQRVRFLGSNQITSFAKTGGYTNVYEATVSDTIPVHGVHLNKRILFEDGNPSKPILEAERHPLQLGLSYRLPYTELIEEDFDTDLATTLTNLDTNVNGGIYYDTVNDKMYIVTSNQTNPVSNGFSYEYAIRDCTSISQIGKYLELEMDNIEFWFSAGSGCVTTDLNKVVRNKCRAFGASVEGFKDDYNILFAYREEAAGCGNDGQNGHYNKLSGWDDTNMRSGTNQSIYYDCWSHDNYDDGCSFHERGDMVTYGGLYEYNWDRGIAPSNTCEAVAHNPTIRYNGQGVGIDSGATGIGYSVVNLPIDNDEKAGCSANVFGGISYGNTIGAAVEHFADNILILNDVTLRDNTSFNLSAHKGKIEANNCRSTQAGGNHKTTSSGGIITVNTDADLV